MWRKTLQRRGLLASKKGMRSSFSPRTASLGPSSRLPSTLMHQTRFRRAMKGSLTLHRSLQRQAKPATVVHRGRRLPISKVESGRLPQQVANVLLRLLLLEQYCPTLGSGCYLTATRCVMTSRWPLRFLIWPTLHM